MLRSGLDMRHIDTPVRTATLALVLDTLIDLGSQPSNLKIAESLRRNVEGQTMSIARAQEAFQKVIDAETAAAEARNG